MKEHEPYNKKEDRANDIKRHDNPRHAGQHSHQTRLQATEDQIREFKSGDKITLDKHITLVLQ